MRHVCLQAYEESNPQLTKSSPAADSSDGPMAELRRPWGTCQGPELLTRMGKKETCAFQIPIVGHQNNGQSASSVARRKDTKITGLQGPRPQVDLHLLKSPFKKHISSSDGFPSKLTGENNKYS